MRRGAAIVLACALWGIASATGAQASLLPPTPAPTPSCGYCSGPPPPPTPVPAATVPVPAAPKAGSGAGLAYKMTVSPGKVARGHSFKVAVTAEKGDTIHFSLQYSHARAASFNGKLNHKPPYVRYFKVAKSVSPGSASMKATFSSPSGVDRGITVTVPFTVLK